MYRNVVYAQYSRYNTLYKFYYGLVVDYQSLVIRIINIIFSGYLSNRCERFGDTFTNVVRTRQVLRRTFYLLAGKLLLRGNISKDCAKWDVKSFLRVQFSSTNCLLVVWSWTELTPSEHALLTHTCSVYLCETFNMALFS